MIVLITDNLYLRATRVDSIAVTENIMFDDDGDAYAPRQKNRNTVTSYHIAISYEMPNTQHPGHMQHVNITAKNRKHCNELMKALIEQVRQQDPDNMMIDGLIEKYFCGEVKDDDRRTKKVRRPRKKKR